MLFEILLRSIDSYIECINIRLGIVRHTLQV